MTDTAAIALNVVWVVGFACAFMSLLAAFEEWFGPGVDNKIVGILLPAAVAALLWPLAVPGLATWAYLKGDRSTGPPGPESEDGE